MKAVFNLFLILLSFSCWAEKIIIEGQPTPLLFRENVYYLPFTYKITPETHYLYVTMNGVPKICFLNMQSDLYLEQVSQVNIVIKGIETMWNCYPYNTIITEVQP